MSNSITYFDSVAEGYNAELEKKGWGLLRRYETISANFFMDRLKKGSAFLDAGSGTGYYGLHFQKKYGVIPTFVDASQKMLDQIGSEKKYCQTLEKLSLSERFETIVCFGALEFCDDIHQAFQNLYNHLAPGGVLYVMVPKNNFLARRYRKFHRQHDLSIQLFSPISLRTLAEAAGASFDKQGWVFPFNYIVKVTRR